MCHHGGHVDAIWRIRLNRPSAAAMWPYVKLLWPLVFLSASSIRDKLEHQHYSSPHGFTYVGFFKCFNGKLLAPTTSTRWAKTSWFWALFGWGAATYYALSPERQRLSARWLHRENHEQMLRYMSATKQHCCMLKGVTENPKFCIFAKWWQIFRGSATN